MAGPLRTIVGVSALPLFFLLSCAPIPSYAALQSNLGGIKKMTCTFSLRASGTWTAGVVGAAVNQPARPLVLRFEAIDVDGGTADAFGAFVGVELASPILVQRFGDGLQFTQMLRSGPLYATTVFNQESRPGKLKAVHVRHESSPVAVPGFTSTPEQYFGDCETTR